MSIAIKRSMAIESMSTPKLAKAAGIPYPTLRKVFELRSVVDYEQLRKIAAALNTPVSKIVEDAENLIAEGKIEDS